MEWTSARTLLLIAQYKLKPILWDRSDENYKNKQLRSECWTEIADELSTNVLEVKRKMNSLLTSFRRERQKEIEKLATTGQIYVSNFAAFKHLKFLTTQAKADKIDEDTNNAFIEDNDISTIHFNSLLEKPDTSTNTKKREKCYNKKKKRKRKWHDKDHLISKAYNMLQQTACALPDRNGNTVFGEYVANKLSGYSQHTKNCVQHLISNILFDADMGKHENIHK